MPSVPAPTSEPIVDVLVKSYGVDLPWLKWCLKAINRFLRHNGEVVVVAPPDCVDRVKAMLYDRQRVVSRVERFTHSNCTGRPAGYIEQQAVKMLADEFTPADQILFLDSDTILNKACDAKTFTNGMGLPLVHFESYDYFRDKHPGVLAWQGMVEATLKRPVKNEYMRRQGQLVWADSLRALRRHLQELHGMAFLDVVESCPGGGFTEFNTLGAFLDERDHSRYHWVQTEYPEGWPIKQFWSYSGITPEIEHELGLLTWGLP